MLLKTKKKSYFLFSAKNFSLTNFQKVWELRQIKQLAPIKPAMLKKKLLEFGRETDKITVEAH